ncbi:MAG: hypothetical protein ACYCVN_12445 [Acidimicrobiales bacterium]
MTIPIEQARRARRNYRGEERWFPLLERYGHSALRRGFMDAGVSPTLAGQLVWFLDEQLSLDRSTAGTSRSRYRHVLAELDPDLISRSANRAIPG